MSLITKQNRVSTKPFATIPSLLQLPAISRPPASASGSDVSSRLGPDEFRDIDLSEGCLVTKTVKYTHRLIAWVDCGCSGDTTAVEDLIDDLEICRYEFKINTQGNLSFLESFVHTSLDDFAFIAITASSSTLEGLIALVQADNDMRQRQIDEDGNSDGRSRDLVHIPSPGHVKNCKSNLFLIKQLSSPHFTDPLLELVALHPHHFLPLGSPLTVYDPTSGTLKNYFAAEDHCLRESPEVHSPRLPPFRHAGRSDELISANVFFIVLNADIKFRRYFRMIQQDPPLAGPLPDDVLALMRRTMYLVDLLYWRPVPTKGSVGEAIAAWELFRLDEVPADMQDRYKSRVTAKLKRAHEHSRRMQSMSLEERMDYTMSLISGPDEDYELPDATSVSRLYADESSVDAWMDDVRPG
ncbi:hypothetical protein Hypma_016031 [Hypsizygus marmoreus]|uniref:Uncharacterized protein n=1 Tax=Hypsizygus marmoreus TaxID=39966 RepID=A0A369K8G0_HYPMA|nr:hypothetical protein Hypma_016031 [Hypsizygus marmoreus]